MNAYPCVEALIEFQLERWFCRIWIDRKPDQPPFSQQEADDLVALARTHLDTLAAPPTCEELADCLAQYTPACNAAQVTDLDSVPRRAVVIYTNW